MKLSALTLLAAISDGKKRILMDRYGATEEQLTIVDAADPTSSGTYAEWITRSWLNQHLINLPEDTAIVRADLGKFNRVKNKAEWGQNSKDVMTYNPERLRAALLTVTEPKAEGIPDVSAEVLIDDGTYIMWKVTTVADAMALSAKSGWCTKGENMASHYLKEAPLYTAFKNGEPLFQYHSGGTTGHPQFMNRFNSTMQSAKIMNAEAYDLISRVPNPDPDLVTVLEKFKAPNLSEAETFSYLKDVLATNPEFAKGNKEFQELERRFLEQRYKIFDEEELVALIDKYGRTGEVVSKFLEDNPRVRGIIKKIEDTPDWAALCKAMENNETFDENEKKIIFKIPGLFSKVFAKFSAANNFDAEVATLKSLIKEGKDTEAYELANKLVKLLGSGFQEQRYRYYNDPQGTIPCIKNSAGYAAVQKYKDIIINMVRPLMASTLTNIANKGLGLTELAKELNEAIDKIQSAANNDNKVIEWCNKRRKEILVPAAKASVAEAVASASTLTDLAQVMGTVERNLDQAHINWQEKNEIKEEIKTNSIIPRIKEEFDAITNSSAGKSFEELAKEFKDKYNEVIGVFRYDSTIEGVLASIGKEMLTAGLTTDLATVPKLKAVTDRLDALDLETFHWAERIAENRKAEIRAERDAKAQARGEARGTGDTTVRTRYAPKKELETYYNLMRAWQHNPDTVARGEKPKLSDRGETFLITSPTINLSDAITYFKEQGKTSPELEAKILASNNLSAGISYLREVKKEAWPELAEKILDYGFDSEYAKAYKEVVFKDKEWPEQKAKAVAAFTNDSVAQNHYLINEMKQYNDKNNEGAKWGLLEKKALDFLSSGQFDSIRHAWWVNDRFFEPLLAYVKSTKSRLDKKLEEKVCEKNEDFATKYLFTLIPKDKISEIIEKYSAATEASEKAKTSSHHFNLFAALMKELENYL
jgi:RecA/RadA recombinase